MTINGYTNTRAQTTLCHIEALLNGHEDDAKIVVIGVGFTVIPPGLKAP